MRIAALFITMLLLTGCSTTRARHSGKRGLFDHILSYERGGQGRAPRETWQETLGDDQVEAMDLRVAKWGPPLKRVQVTSHFGKRGGDYHDGIDLRARDGTPVFSVEAGTVAYAGSAIGGYGRMVVVRHDGGLSTVYAHNSRLLVKRGARVRKGQRIALSGRTGRSRGAHVHFEVRSGITAVDPLALGRGPWWSKRLVEAPSRPVPAHTLANSRRRRGRSLASVQR